MLSALLVFLIGALILAVVVYVCHMIIGMISLPEPINRIALLIVGLIGLVLLLILTIGIYSGGWRAGDVLR